MPDKEEAKKTETSVCQSNFSGVLSAAEQAVNSLEKLRDHWQAIGRDDNAQINIDQIKTIKWHMTFYK
jgi:hypothetical protein